MIRQQLFIGAALLAGAAIGYCVAPREALPPAADGVAEAKAPAPIPDGGAEASVKALRERVKSLERELAELRSAGSDAVELEDAAEAGRDEARVEGPRNGAERFRAEMERLKQEEPERYRQIVTNIENFRRRAAEHRQAKIDYLSTIDTTEMSEPAKAVHETLKAALARRTALDAELGAEDLSDERREELMGQLRDAEHEIRRLNRAERANLLGSVAAAVGMEGDAAKEFSDVIEATDSGFGGHHGPPPPGPPPGVRAGQAFPAPAETTFCVGG